MPSPAPHRPVTALSALEVAWLIRVQRHASAPLLRRAGTVLDRAGEHAGASIGLLTVAAVVDRRRRRAWLEALARVVASHGASVVLKRVVRRVRPDDPGVQVRVATPSRWSFPSSHAASTTTAAITTARVLGTPLPLALVPAMATSRVALGVHHPTDVLAGVALGAAAAQWPSRAPRPRGSGRR